MSTLITDSNELTHFTAVFSKHDLAANLAPQLSCIEVEALAGLLRALGEPATADTWIQEHVSTDELGDAHYQATPSNTWPRSTRRKTCSATAASNHPRAHDDGVGWIRVENRSEWSRERRPAGWVSVCLAG